MTLEEIIKQTIKEKSNTCLDKVNQWGSSLTEEEKEEIFKKGGVL